MGADNVSMLPARAASTSGDGALAIYEAVSSKTMLRTSGTSPSSSGLLGQEAILPLLQHAVVDCDVVLGQQTHLHNMRWFIVLMLSVLHECQALSSAQAGFNLTPDKQAVLSAAWRLNLV